MSSGFAVADGVALAAVTGVVVVFGDGEPTAGGAAVHDRRSATAIAR
jgi:hypothetical protein